MRVSPSRDPCPAGGAGLEPGDAAVPLEQLVRVHKLGLAVAQAVGPDPRIMQDLRAGVQDITAQRRHIPRSGKMPLSVQPAGVPERGILQPQFSSAGVHPFHKDRFAPAHQLRHGHRSIVGRGNADGPQHLIQRELLPGLQPDLTAAHVVGVFAHRHKGIQRQPAAMDGLKGQQQGHQLGDGSNGHPLIRCFLIEHTARFRLHEDCRPAFQLQPAVGRSRRQHHRGIRLHCRSRFPNGHPQPGPLCRTHSQRKQPEAEHPRAEQGQISPFHSSYLPAVNSLVAFYAKNSGGMLFSHGEKSAIIRWFLLFANELTLSVKACRL